MLLLDTSVLLWVLVDSPRLGPVSRARIASASVTHVSAVTVAELTIKSMLGKIVIPDDLPAAIRQQSFAELAVTCDHADAIKHFPGLARHDPFDRLLLAQASASGMDFMTADRVLLGLGHDFILDAAT